MATEPSRLEQLEDEGDIAADYLEELLDIADLDGDIDIDVENDRASVSIFSDADGDRYLQALVGEDGKVLDALQELTRLAVHNKTGERSRIMVDIAHFRAEMKAELQELGRSAIAEMERDDLDEYEFEAMNPFERKVLHDVAAEAGYHSESAGYAPDRYVIFSREVPAADDSEEADAETDEDGE